MPTQPSGRGSAVRAELAGPVIGVVLRHGVPLRVEVLEDPVVVVARKVVDEHLGDVEGPFEPAVLPGHIGDDEVRLDGMHARVTATVCFSFRKFPVPRVEAHAGVVVPEPGVSDAQCLVEQFLGARAVGRNGAGSREEHEGVLVTGLGVVYRSVPVYLGIPAAELIIVEDLLRAAMPWSTRVAAPGRPIRAATAKL